METPSFSNVSWIRRRASYIALGGIIGQVGSVLIYIRGIAHTLTLFVPAILVVAIVLGGCHFWILQSPFKAFIVWTVAIFFLASPHYIRAIAKGQSSVRTIGQFACLLALGAAILGNCYLVEAWHARLGHVVFTWEGILSTLVAGASGVGVLQKLLPKELGGSRLRFNIVVSVVGLVSMLGFLVCIVTLTDFVAYGDPCKLIPSSIPYETMGYLAVIVAIACGVVVVVKFRACFPFMNRNDKLWSIACLAPAVLLAIAGTLFSEKLHMAFRDIGTTTRPLKSLLTVLSQCSNLPETSRALISRLKKRVEDMDAYYEVTPSEEQQDVRLSPASKRYYRMAQLFVQDFYTLSQLDELDRERIRREVTTQCRAKLVAIAEAKLDKEQSHLTEEQRSTIEAECETEIVYQWVYNSVAEELRDKDIDKRSVNAVFDSLARHISDTSIANRLKELSESSPSAINQSEFARFVGRSSELERSADSAANRTSLDRADIGLLPRASEYSLALRHAVARAVVTAYVSRMKVDQLDLIRPYFDRLPPNFLAMAMEALEIQKQVKRFDWENASKERLVRACNNSEIKRSAVCDRALQVSDRSRVYLQALAELSASASASDSQVNQLELYYMKPGESFSRSELLKVAMARLAIKPTQFTSVLAADQAVAMVAAGEYADLEDIAHIRRYIAFQIFRVKFLMLMTLATALLAIGFVGEFNNSSLHGLYREKLAETFLLNGPHSQSPSRSDLRLTELHDSSSVSPYLLLNAVVNLQGLTDLAVRDTRCDSFVFSKYYSGGSRTGYALTADLESAYPKLRLSSAVAISAAAASPNMGRYTMGGLVALMTLLNVRLGYWIPNPRHLYPATLTHTFDSVFRKEIEQQVNPRWLKVYGQAHRRAIVHLTPSTQNGLIGYAASGGGIRSAALNLGILQALHELRVFPHIDYISTVSGGGYIGASLVALMQCPRTVNSQTRITPCSCQRPQIQPRTLPAIYIFREMFGQLNATTPWVNLSDGGHLENLGVMELLRRRCKVIIVGDGEAEPSPNRFRLHGLGELQRIARAELGIEIHIDARPLLPSADTGQSPSHWVLGTIVYPGTVSISRTSKVEIGYLLYLKSSLTGNEEVAIQAYKQANSRFPHESTSDQFFDTAQFESYHNLGLKIALTAFTAIAASRFSLDDHQQIIAAMAAWGCRPG